MKDFLNQSSFGGLLILILPFLIMVASSVAGRALFGSDNGAYYGLGVGVGIGALILFATFKWLRN